MTIETAACSIRYAGEYFDNETGMYYLRARYYDPNIGRFISEDSYWGEDSNPLSLNLYTYAYNNPIRFIDPSGHRSDEDIFSEIRKKAQAEWIINEINAEKETWYNEERGAGKNQSKPTAAQEAANKRANQLRNDLLKLENGSPELQQLIKDDTQGKAGAWEQYTLTKTVQDMYDDPVFDPGKVDVLRERAEDFFISTSLGVSIYGIDKKDITEESMTRIEKAAQEFVTEQVISMATAKLEQAWDNPGKAADDIVQYITDIIENKYVTEDSPEYIQEKYQQLKYNAVRYIVLGVIAVDYTKGFAGLLNFLDEFQQRHSPLGIIKSVINSAINSEGDALKFLDYFKEE